MGLGSGRRYGHGNKPAEETTPPAAVPTYVCSRCGRLRALTSKAVSLTCHQDNLLLLTAKICEDCGKLLLQWMKK